MKKKILLFAAFIIICGLSGCGAETLDIVTEEIADTEEDTQSVSGDAGTAGEKPETGIQEPENREPEMQESAVMDTEVDSMFCVYVCGAVTREGVYYLPAGSIKKDALDAAGGYGENAARGFVNLAEPVQDGEKIYFPTAEEMAGITPADDTVQDGKTETSASKTVNLNTATKEELMTLPGIGESKALAIIKYREENQGFRSTDEIMQIDGIKEGVYNKIKDLISI